MRRVIGIRCGHDLTFLCSDAAPFFDLWHRRCHQYANRPPQGRARLIAGLHDNTGGYQ